MMTKKDFTLIADCIVESYKTYSFPIDWKHEKYGIANLEDRLIRAIGEVYPRFDKFKFLKYIEQEYLRTPKA